MRRIQVWVPGARDTARTVRIAYRVERALRFFPEHDELYWTVTGDAPPLRFSGTTGENVLWRTPLPETKETS